MIPDNFPLNVVENLVSGGMTRASGMLSKTTRRRSSAERTLRSQGSDKIDDTNAAIAELEQVIGSHHEALDPLAKSFLTEIERSTIPEGLVEASMFGCDPEFLLPAFKEIYNTFQGRLPFEAQRLFHALAAAVRGQIESRLANLGFLDVVRADNSAATNRLVRFGQAFGTDSGEEPLLHDQIVAIRVKFARASENKYRYLQIETNQGQKRIRLKNIADPS